MEVDVLSKILAIWGFGFAFLEFKFPDKISLINKKIKQSRPKKLKDLAAIKFLKEEFGVFVVHSVIGSLFAYKLYFSNETWPDLPWWGDILMIIFLIFIFGKTALLFATTIVSLLIIAIDLAIQPFRWTAMRISNWFPNRDPNVVLNLFIGLLGILIGFANEIIKILINNIPYHI